MEIKFRVNDLINDTPHDIRKLLMKFIQYSLTGEVIEQYSCDFDQLNTHPVGKKVKVTMNDGKTYVGFWNVWQGQKVVEVAEINKYDLDESTAKLRSNNVLTTFVPTSKISQIEAIVHSNPRWGIRPSNKFEFQEPVKIDTNAAFFKNWSRR